MNDFMPVELTVRIHKADQVVYVFKGLVEWLQHVVRHFGRRAEPWARVLGCDAGSIYSLRDSIPGNTDKEKEHYIEGIGRQNLDVTAVQICMKAVSAYRTVAPIITQELEKAIKVPRYAYFPRSNPLSKCAGGGPTTYVIGESYPFVMILRGADLRTCYFMSGNGRSLNDLGAVQSALYRQCRVRPMNGGWADEKRSPAFPYTERSMGWRQLHGRSHRRRQFQPPSRGGSS